MLVETLFFFELILVQTEAYKIVILVLSHCSHLYLAFVFLTSIDDPAFVMLSKTMVYVSKDQRGNNFKNSVSIEQTDNMTMVRK